MIYYSGGLANLIQIDFGGTCLPVRSPSMLTSPSFSTSSSKVISKNLTNSLLILWDDNHCESLYIILHSKTPFPEARKTKNTIGLGIQPARDLRHAHLVFLHLGIAWDPLVQDPSRSDNHNKHMSITSMIVLIHLTEPRDTNDN